MKAGSGSLYFSDRLESGGPQSAHEAFEANLSAAHSVLSYYRACVQNGCSILFSNTPVAFDEEHWSFPEWEKRVRQSLQLAFEAAQHKVPVWGLVPASVQPARDWSYALYCERQEQYRRAAALFLDAGCPGVFLSGFRSIVDARCALNGVDQAGCRFRGLSFRLEGLEGLDSGPGPELDVSCVGTALDPFQPTYLVLEGHYLDTQLLAQFQKLRENSYSPVGLSVRSLAQLPDQVEETRKVLEQIGFSFLGAGQADLKMLRTWSTAVDVPASRPIPEVRVCSAHKVVTIGRQQPFRIIGERINPTGKKKLARKLVERDWDFIGQLARQQEEAGAEIIDLNVGGGDIAEIEVLPELTQWLNHFVSSPLVIDSANMEAMRRAALLYNGRPLLNSTTAEPDKLSLMCDIARETGSAFVVLTFDQEGIPADARKRLAIAKNVLSVVQKHGFSGCDILIDCLTLSAAAQPDQARETLEAINAIAKEPGLCTILGLSNISFGLPDRTSINQSFLAMAMAAGLDCALLDPRVPELHATIKAASVLVNRDKAARRYLASHDQTRPTSDNVQRGEQALDQLAQDIVMALSRKDTARLDALTGDLLESGWSKQQVLEQALIPGIQKIGDLFGQGLLFLPQLMAAAESMHHSFDQMGLTSSGQEMSSTPRATIMLATVKGDIHDLGKNLVRTFLLSHGFKVLDLGKNVSRETIRDAVREHQPELLGLSALMTTTMLEMRDTVHFLRSSGLSLKIIVGGAVITEDFARTIGADGYARNAPEAVTLTTKLLGKTSGDGSSTVE